MIGKYRNMKGNTMFTWLKKLLALNADSRVVAENAITLDLTPGSDGWLGVAIDGDFPNPDRRIGVQRIRRKSLDAMAAAINAKSADANWRGIWLGIGHQDGPALAWSRQARVVTLQLDGKPRDVMQLLPAYNDSGLKIIGQEKQFKSVSPGFLGVHDSQGFYIPDELDHVAFTNRPVIADIPPAVNAAGKAEGLTTENTESTEKDGIAQNAEGAFVEEFLGRIRTLIAGAKTDLDAWNMLWNAENTLQAAKEQIQALRSLVNGIGATLGQPPPSPSAVSIPSIPSDYSEKLMTALTAVKSAANALPAVQASLANVEKDFNDFAAEMAVRTGKVAAANQQRALQILATNRDAALACWFKSAAGDRPGATPRADLRALPTDPLAAVNRIPSALPETAALVEPVIDAQAVAENCRVYMAAHPGTPYQTAFNVVVNEMQQPKK